jgi:hypothetical protein
MRALARAGYSRLDQLDQLDQVDQVSEAGLRRLHGVGPKALAVLSEALAANGLSFAP